MLQKFWKELNQRTQLIIQDKQIVLQQLTQMVTLIYAY